MVYSFINRNIYIYIIKQIYNYTQAWPVVIPSIIIIIIIIMYLYRASIQLPVQARF